MTSSGNINLHGVAQKLLDAVQNELNLFGVSIPERVYVAPGADLAYDCDQLTVHLTRIITNFQTGDSPVPHGASHRQYRKSAEFYVTLARCVASLNDDGTAPPADTIDADATITMNDAFCLRMALENIEHKHAVVPVNVPVTVGQVTSFGPLGGMAGSQAMYTCEIVNAGWVG